MDFPAELFPISWHVVAVFITLVALVSVVRGIKWREVLESESQLGLCFGLAVVMMFLWSLRAGVLPGLNLHLLGAMVACLLLGPRLAMCTLALSLIGLTVNGGIEWSAWPLNFVTMVLVPVLIANGFHRAVERFLPPHFFVFIFATAFAGSAVVILLNGLFVTVLLGLAGAYPWWKLMSDYLPFFLLLSFAEAWISGALTAAFVVYKPAWVAAFDDQKYLDK